jgi:beta-xylosidase
MKTLLFLICFFPFVYSGDSNEQENTNSNQPVPLADPFILYHDGMYYAYGTHSADGIEVYYSESLESWKKHTDLALHKKDSYGEKWFWAPEVYYNEANKKFYLYYSAEEHICVATSDSPLGPFEQKEKKPMREEKGIDSSLFIDDDGTPYLFFVRFTNGNVIWVVELENDLETLKEETLTKCIEVSQPWEMSLGRVVEGPSIIKKNGTYYLIYSGNDYRSPDYGVGYATAKAPLGEWKKSETNPIFQKPNPELVGVGHGAIVADKDGRYKYVFHAHYNKEKVAPRLMYITDITISDSGITMSKDNIITPKVINE